MKKLFSIALITAAMFTCFTGCDEVPDKEQVRIVAETTGVTCATVCNIIKDIDNDTRNVIIDIMNQVETTIPNDGETFKEVWGSIGNRYIDSLVKDKKIDEGKANIAKQAVSIICDSLDYLVSKKVKISQYKDLVGVAVHSFCDKFLSIFKPANKTLSLSEANMVDQELLDMLVEKYNIK